MGLRLAFTADLHWGHHSGNDATRLLAEHLRGRPPDVLVLAGDVGTGPHFAACLEQFADLPGRKPSVPGNHDIGFPSDPPRDSRELYEEALPATAARFGFHSLDRGPLSLPEEGLALVGSINWYDYSWALDALRRFYPAEEHRLHSKQ